MKQQLNSFLTRLRYNFSGLHYAWFMEFQRRGAPHIHLLLSVLPDGNREFVADTWARISTPDNLAYSSLEIREGVYNYVSEQWTREAVRKQHLRRASWECARSANGCIRYAVKYVAKQYQKLPPVWFVDCGRYCGHNFGRYDGVSARFSAREDEVRELASVLGRNLDKMSVLPKYVFIDGDLTKILKSGNIPLLNRGF